MNILIKVKWILTFLELYKRENGYFNFARMTKHEAAISGGAR